MSGNNGVDINSSWSEARVEQLRKLWADGLSASQIAAEIGGGISRNAVIGKVHRLGLAGRAKSSSPSAPRPRKAPAARPAVPVRAAPSRPMTRGATALKPQFAPEVEVVAYVEPALPEEVVIPFSQRITIMELREETCRWPMGDPLTSEFRYCGGVSPVGTPYCTYHSRAAYQPVNERRRERV